MPAQNIPNTGQGTIRARMKVESFVSVKNPDSKQIRKFDEEVNTFLDTIDNTKRYLNGRNSYSIDGKIYILVWYLEKMVDEPVTTPFGDKVKQGKPVVEENAKQNNNAK